MSINLKTIINNKLQKNNISESSLLVFNINLDMIVNSKYKVNDRLKEINKLTSSNNNTWSKINKILNNITREIKQNNNQIKKDKQNIINAHLERVPTSFKNKIDDKTNKQVNGENALRKVLSIIKGKVKVDQLKVNYKKKELSVYQFMIK